ncbi:MAG: hypothetical protein DRH30_00590 [Deltaproteobacteria bacterium]|nr:MAG: hypothetical protein DRH30_00590 [Deltaproteobacteria bacterium]
MRFINGEPVGEYHVGRVCDETIMPWASTKRRICGGCPAYRGKLLDGSVQAALAPDLMTINSLSKPEYEQYNKWVKEEFEPERFYAYLEGGVKGWDEERQAEYMREWRASHVGYDKRERRRDKTYMAQKQRESRARTSTRNRPAPARTGAVREKDAVTHVARAQEQGGYGLTDPLAGKVLKSGATRVEKRRQNKALFHELQERSEEARKAARG